jgi:hypothetical protein
MGRGTTAAIVIGGVAAAAGILYYLTQKTQGQGQYILQISTTTGGTTNPAPSPSGVAYSPGEVVTITATPSSGYTIGDVLIDGISIGPSSTFQVTMNMNHTVNVIFYQGGQPPPSIPVAIVSMGSVQVIGYYGCKISLGILNTLSKIEVKMCDQNWNFGAWAHTPMQFKVIDSNGKGVPNVIVQLYPDQYPDTSKYKGYLILNDLQLNGGPLTLKTDQNGIVTVNLSYFADLSSLNQPYKLPYDAGLNYTVLYVLVPITYAPYDGSKEGLGIPFIGKGGQGVTGQTAAMGPIILNNVRAVVKDTSIPAAQGLCYCGFNVKML